MRNTSAPASNSRAIIVGVGGGGPERGDDLGAAQASHCAGASAAAVRRRRRRPRRRQHRRARGVSGRCCGACSAVSVSCTVQERCSPVSTSKKPVRSIAARQAILGAPNGEFLVARAHVGLARPFAAAVVVDRVDVIEARDQRAAQQRFAGSRRQVPPAFGGPALGVLVADRDADPAAGVVAQPEIGHGRRADSQQQQRRERDASENAAA